MNAGPLLVRGSIWPAVLCGLLAILDEHQPRRARWLWATGLLLYLVHVAAAFGFVHGWSHQEALESTRIQTAELTGWNSGFGLYVNYAFTVAWLVYATASFAVDARPADWVRRAWNFFFVFLSFNGAVVFAPASTRPIGIGLFTLFAVAWVRQRRRRLRAWRRRLPPPSPTA